MKLTISDDLRNHLVQQQEAHRSDLINRYQQALRKTLFSNRSAVRPSMLKKIATDEVDAFDIFLSQPQMHTLERGIQLYQIGLSELSVLRLNRVTRQFFIPHLKYDQIVPALEVVDVYQEQVIQGFIQSLEKAVFREQEQTRHAFERVANRDKP